MKLKDIAKEINVSVSTISRVLNNKPGVNPEIRKKVIEFTKQYSNNKKFLKQIKNSYHLKNILLLMPRVKNCNYFYDLTESIIKVGAKKNMNIFIKYSSPTQKKEYEILEEIDCDNFFEGIIFLNSTHYTEYLELKNTLNNLKKPIVLLHNYITGTTTSGVFVDNINLSYKITNYYLNQNLKNIYIIIGEEESESSQKRVEGFLLAFKEQQIEVTKEQIIYTDWNDNNIIFNKIYNFVKSTKNIDAIICGDENIAFELVTVFNKLNIKDIENNRIFSWHMNEQVIKLGYNFLYFKDDLTTLSNYALELLLEQSENKTSTVKKISLSTDTISSEI